jgi:hypothetical protein
MRLRHYALFVIERIKRKKCIVQSLKSGTRLPRELKPIIIDFEEIQVHDWEIEVLKNAIYHGNNPIVEVNASMLMNLQKEGIIKKDGLWLQSLTYIGEHLLVLVGWDENGFICKNSWGIDWGNGGFCTICYDVISNPFYFYAWRTYFGDTINIQTLPKRRK